MVSHKISNFKLFLKIKQNRGILNLLFNSFEKLKHKTVDKIPFLLYDI